MMEKLIWIIYYRRDIVHQHRVVAMDRFLRIVISGMSIDHMHEIRSNIFFLFSFQTSSFFYQ